MLLDKIQILIRPPSNAAAQSEIVRRSSNKTSQVSQPSESCKAMQSSSLQDQRTITKFEMHPKLSSSLCSHLYNMLILSTVLLLVQTPQVVQCRSITPAGSMVQEQDGTHSTQDTMDSPRLIGKLWTALQYWCSKTTNLHALLAIYLQICHALADKY